MNYFYNSMTSHITSNINTEFKNEVKHPTPFENIMTLHGHIIQMHDKRKPLLAQLKLLTCSESDYTLEQCNEMEKVEEEVEFINNYSKTLMDQLVVIMNEHDVKGIPPLLLD